jgi:hypothetical protein
MSRLASRYKKDEATLKLLIGALLFPLSWLLSALAAGWWYHEAVHAVLPSIPNRPAFAGVAVALLAAVGGAAALRYLRVARETARAVRVRLTRRLRRRAIERLRRERAELHDALIAMVADLELPGEVLADGRVVRHARAAGGPTTSSAAGSASASTTTTRKKKKKSPSS